MFAVTGISDPGYRRIRLFADKLYNQLSMARPDIEIQIYNLLPHPQGKLPIDEWHNQRGAKQCRTNMAVAVEVIPGGMVSVRPVGRNNLIKQTG